MPGIYCCFLVFQRCHVHHLLGPGPQPGDLGLLPGRRRRAPEDAPLRAALPHRAPPLTTGHGRGGRCRGAAGGQGGTGVTWSRALRVPALALLLALSRLVATAGGDRATESARDEDTRFGVDDRNRSAHGLDGQILVGSGTLFALDGHRPLRRSLGWPGCRELGAERPTLRLFVLRSP